MSEVSVIIVSLSIVLIAGILAGRLAEIFNFPRTIPLIITGILIAVISNIGFTQLVIDIDAIREMAILTAELALITILFKEGMHLNLHSFRKYLIIIVLITTFGTVLTTIIVGYAIFSFNSFFINFPLTLAIALLIGAIFTPTDPAATFAALRGGQTDSKVDEKFETILGGESVLNDVIAIILVVVILIPSALSFTDQQREISLSPNILVEVLWEFFGGIFIGLIIGYLALRLINSLSTNTEESIVSLAAVISIFGLGFILTVSSAIGALIAGIIISNPKYFNQPSYSHKEMNIFWENLTFLFEILAFVFIGAIFSLKEINPDIILFSILLSVIVMLGRFAGIFIITWILELFKSTKEHLNNKERIFISFAGMKGLTTGILAILAYLAFQGSASSIGQVILFSSILVLIITGLIQGVFLKKVAAKLGILNKFNELDIYMAQKVVLRSSLDFLVKEFEEKKNINAEAFSKLSLPLKEELATLEEKLLIYQSEITKNSVLLATAIKMNDYALEETEKAYSEGIITNDKAYEIAINIIYDSIKDLKNRLEHAQSISASSIDEEEKIEQSIIELDTTLDKVNRTLGKDIKSFLSLFQKSKQNKENSQKKSSEL